MGKLILITLFLSLSITSAYADFQNTSKCGWEMKQYQEDCRNGDAYGCHLIADSYIRGRNGFKKDVDFGVALYSYACDNGYGDGCLFGGNLSVISNKKRRDFLSKHCDLYGKCSDWRMSYFNGCENGNSNDCYGYAQITEKGLGNGESDAAGSLVYYDSACSGGIQDSCVRANELRQRGWKKRKKFPWERKSTKSNNNSNYTYKIVTKDNKNSHKGYRRNSINKQGKIVPRVY